MSSRVAPLDRSFSSRGRRALAAALSLSKHTSSTPSCPCPPPLAPVSAPASPGPCATSLIGSPASLHRPRRSRHGRRLRQLADLHGCALVVLLTHPNGGPARGRAGAAARWRVARHWDAGAW